MSGQVTLGKLRIKKGVFDWLRLPIDVVEGVYRYYHRGAFCLCGWAGHLGKFSLSLHWFNLGNQPVQVLIEDLYVLVVPRKEDGQDLDELERRIQEAKLERLQNAEVLQTQAAEVKGMNFCLHMIATNSRAFKAPIIALKVKALLHHCSENFLTTSK